LIAAYFSYWQEVKALLMLASNKTVTHGIQIMSSSEKNKQVGKAKSRKIV
jgi:hypothetical protein